MPAAGAGTARPRVSIVIPHLNQPAAAARCLASIAAQDYPADLIETILVDNGSSAPLDALRAAWPGVRFLTEPTPGPGPARNTGVAHATGAILAFIDADCRAHPHWVSAAVEGVVGTGGPVGGDVRIDFLDEGDPTPLESYEAVFAFRQKMYVEKHRFSGTGNLAMTPDVYRAVGPFAGIGVAEDRDWGRRAHAAGRPLSYRADMIVYHPARTAFGELEAKWRRHVAHQLAEHRERRRPGWRWAALAGAVLASAVPHTAMLLASPRIGRFGHRLRGLGPLYRIRGWRLREMLRQARSADSAAADWNRPQG